MNQFNTKLKGAIIFRAGILAGAALALVSATSAQFWKKKPSYQQWSVNECREMLSQSPWSGEYKIAKVVIESIGASATGGDPTVEGRETPHVTYRAQFWSARPIREAMMRLQQLDPKYSKFTPEEKKKFDDQAAKFIETDFPDTVVVHLSYTTVRAYSLPLSRYWQSKSAEELKDYFRLVSEPGHLVPLQVQMQPAAFGGGAEFQLVFPRMHNGAPIATPSSKSLGIEVSHPGIGGVLPAERVFIPFPVKKMLVGNDVIF